MTLSKLLQCDLQMQQYFRLKWTTRYLYMIIVENKISGAFYGLLWHIIVTTGGPTNRLMAPPLKKIWVQAWLSILLNKYVIKQSAYFNALTDPRGQWGLWGNAPKRPTKFFVGIMQKGVQTDGLLAPWSSDQGSRLGALPQISVIGLRSALTMWPPISHPGSANVSLSMRGCHGVILWVTVLFMRVNWGEMISPINQMQRPELGAEKLNANCSVNFP